MSEHLIGAERYWARYQPWLKSIGYILRPRYQPDWKPSWLTSNRPESESEDSLVVQLRALVLDARRQCDNFPVALKLVPTTTQELPIWRYLSSPERLVDSRNHCVPLLTIHPLPDTDDLVLSVMPLLLSYRIPTFDTVGEVLSCVHHLLQGLTFLHEHNVTHLDICTQNTMHDPGSKLYPKGFHPLQPSSYTPDPNSPQLVPSYSVSSRTLAPVKFYFIDFGESFMFESYKKRHYISGSVGHYPDLPEFPDDRYYDPFPVDIRALGETLRRGFSSVDISAF
ncbi:hypothetical protein SISSUDRAFT_982509 [Sistotremastrum suecicum HHB10207 ss-3]|uniref:Protein kinase domain-containing protein n=1 Tax=Sistotremastrum suecicum HHB10207 ss-3 TaxID=1314776 RepID=A0A166FW35_9AGAM|nr:hypothetical protein SISSUDRAFT_982509 [Sistotremastrum suecicum HHB10207 ss-3]